VAVEIVSEDDKYALPKERCGKYEEWGSEPSRVSGPGREGRKALFCVADREAVQKHSGAKLRYSALLSLAFSMSLGKQLFSRPRNAIAWR
jgi:hypothetical protein